MTRLAPAVLALSLFLGCSRSGHHPEPIAPVQPKSEYDVRSVRIKIYKNSTAFHTYTPVPHPQRTLSVADSSSAMVGFTFQNVGLATLPKRSAYFSFTINDQVVFKSRGNPFPITPGGIDSGGRPVKNFRSSFKLNKPGRYEVRFRVWLVERFGETNLDNNELIHYVDVEE